MISHPDFRYDINALRAIAVVAVVLFHFQVPGFSGGFVGVDVFFVISGFLMTAIIVSALEAEQAGGRAFSLGRFYLARARRIVPALLVMTATLLVLGWWLLPTLDYQQLARQSVYALAFVSNLRYQREAGYFDADSHEKWLLHTWSLSVEWQFYLLFPLLLIALWKLSPTRPSRQTLGIAIGAALLLSFGWSLWQTQQDSSAAFFLLPSRAWQLLAGALVYLLPALSPRQAYLGRYRPAISMVGLLLIVLAVVSIDGDSHWPGVKALLPVLGTALMLASAQQASWMQHKAVQWTGLSSYSLYLWHWPVVVSLVYIEGMGQGIVVATGVLLSVALGALSYHAVENPTRRLLTQAPAWRAGWGIVIAAVLVILPARVIDSHDGVSGRLSPEVEAAAAEALNFDPRRDECLASQGRDFPWCVYGGEDIRAVVIGDSHAASVFTAIAAAVQESADSGSYKRAGIRASAYNGCPTLFEPWPHTQRDCQQFNQFLLEQLASVLAEVPVIVVNRSSYYVSRSDDVSRYQEAIVHSACTLAEQQRQVYLMRPIPEMDVHVPKTLARQLVTGLQRPIGITRAAYDQRHAAVIAAQDRAAAECGARIIDVTEALCDAEFCSGVRDGRPLYYDEDHLSEFGGRVLSFRLE